MCFSEVLILYINGSSSLKLFFEQTLNVIKHLNKGKGKANFQHDNKNLVDIFMLH